MNNIRLEEEIKSLRGGFKDLKSVKTELCGVKEETWSVRTDFKQELKAIYL